MLDYSKEAGRCRLTPPCLSPAADQLPGMSIVNKYLTPSLYAGRLFGRTILEICLLVILIEGIYLSERSISILKMIIDQPIGLANFIPLLAWTAPEVQLALPLAVLIAVYRVILRRRERLEFIALASGGQSTISLIRSTTAVALSALLFSSLVSGFVYPYAKFAFRHDDENIRYLALRAGSSPGQFLHFPNYTIYVFPSEKAQAKRPVFIKQVADNGMYRIVNADRAELIPGPRPGSMIIRMTDVTVNNFPNQHEPWVASEPERLAGANHLFCNDCGDGVRSLRTVALMRELDLKDLVHFEPRGVTFEEWTTPELLGWTAAPGQRQAKPGATIEATRRFARSLLCFLAPFLAWLTLTFTTRGSQVYALPATCIALMCADIGFSQAISTFAPRGAGLVAAVLVAVTAAIVALCLRNIIARQHFAVFPALARS